jgi:hypothetical protein
MRWIRSNRQYVSWLALAAMALQLVLSFGHIHLDKLPSGSTNAVVAGAKAPASQPSPAHPDDDYCPICAAIHLASSSFLPDAPQLPVPFVSQSIEHSRHIVFVFVAPQGTAFQSRAPPLA